MKRLPTGKLETFSFRAEHETFVSGQTWSHMSTITLQSKDKKIDLNEKRSKAAFLIYDGTNYKFVSNPMQNDHCVAAFFRQNGDVVAIRMHSSITLSPENEHVKWLKNKDSVFIGLETFTVILKRDKKIVNSVLGLFVALSLCAVGMFSFAKLKRESQPVVLAPQINENVELVGIEVPSQENVEMVEQGAFLLKQAEDEMANQRYRDAREKLVQLTELFKDASVKPSYYSKVEDGIRSSELKLTEKFLPQITRAEVLIAGKDHAKLKESVILMREVLKEWPEFSRAEEFLKSAYSALDKLAMPHVMKADTLRQLSGCKDAISHYRAALNAAAFPEVNAYQTAEAGMRLCN